MFKSDENNPNAAPPADFIRHWGARLLRRERPRFEQGENANHNFMRQYLRMYDEWPNSFGIIELGQRTLIGFNLFPGVKAHQVIWPKRVPLPKRWMNAANFQSRFVKLPNPAHLPRLPVSQNEFGQSIQSSLASRSAVCVLNY